MSANAPKQTLVDKVYENIKRDLIQHRLKPGDKIDIKEFSSRYGVSATPIKHALNRLISDNIIENYPRQGMYVKSIQPEEINEIFDLRLMMDLYFTNEIITTVNYNESLRDELLQNVKEHLEIIANLNTESTVDDYIEGYNHDYKFHELILKCSGSKKLLDIYHSINPFLYTHYIYNKQSKKKDIEGVREHELILEAILSEDEESLKKAMQLHYENSKKAIGLILKVHQMI